MLTTVALFWKWTSCTYEISGSDIGANDFPILECETVYSGLQMSAFRRNVLPPSSWLLNNVGEKISLLGCREDGGSSVVRNVRACGVISQKARIGQLVVNRQGLCNHYISVDSQVSIPLVGQTQLHPSCSFTLQIHTELMIFLLWGEH